MERLTEKQRHILQQKLCDMKRRCYNPEEKFYKDYGGRGIKVCDEWMDKKEGHSNFQKWAVENGWEEGRSIDRIDVNGNYEPNNCRWATPEEQANNRRNNNYVTINGVTKTTSEWARQIGISQNAFTGRINSGWTGEELLKPKFKPLKMSKAEMAKEIRAWRNAEEQGLLVRLPCKVGDIVYVDSAMLPIENMECYEDIDNKIPSYFQGRVVSFRFAQRNWAKIAVKAKWLYEWIDDETGPESDYIECEKNFSILLSTIGKTVFLTRKEAEKKLEEMENGK